MDHLLSVLVRLYIIELRVHPGKLFSLGGFRVREQADQVYIQKRSDGFKQEFSLAESKIPVSAYRLKLVGGNHILVVFVELLIAHLDGLFDYSAFLWLGRVPYETDSCKRSVPPTVVRIHRNRIFEYLQELGSSHFLRNYCILAVVEDIFLEERSFFVYGIVSLVS